VRLLVANITIEEDEINEPAACDPQFSAQHLHVDVSFDTFSFMQSGPGSVYQGNQSGHLVGTLTQQSSDAWTTCLYDGSPCSPLTGEVSVNDTIQADDDTTTIVGSGSPHDAMIMGSYIGLTLHPETCTFDLTATFRVAATFTSGNDANDGYWGGVLVLLDQPIVIGSGGLQGSKLVNVVKDTQRTGYVALESGLYQTFQGSTMARWTVTPAE
jgi:hypothetical protein